MFFRRFESQALAAPVAVSRKHKTVAEKNCTKGEARLQFFVVRANERRRSSYRPVEVAEKALFYIPIYSSSYYFLSILLFIVNKYIFLFKFIYFYYFPAFFLPFMPLSSAFPPYYISLYCVLCSIMPIVCLLSFASLT